MTVERGDLLLIRTGHMSRYLDRGDWRNYDLDPFPGVSVYTAKWMHEKQIAAVASDNYAVEVRPSELPPTARRTAATCWWRRRYRSRAPSARRSIRTR